MADQGSTTIRANYDYRPMMYLTNLDEDTRRSMRSEVEGDIEGDRLVMSPRLTPQGGRAYPNLLLDAVEGGTPESFAAQLAPHMTDWEPSRTRYGRPITKKVPWDSHLTLGLGEFNRFYARGLCARVVAGGGGYVEVYRAMSVATPRRRSQLLIGTVIDAEKLLHDLRIHAAIEPALGVPGGANSGISIQLPSGT